MIKVRVNYSLVFVLVTAFLALQWSTTHVHLAEEHDHGGSHHHHSIDFHAHQSLDNTNGDYDFHHSNDPNVVEIDKELYSQKTEKPKKPPTTVAISNFLLLASFVDQNSLLVVFSENPYNKPFWQPSNPRAPPTALPRC